MRDADVEVFLKTSTELSEREREKRKKTSAVVDVVREQQLNDVDHR